MPHSYSYHAYWRDGRPCCAFRHDAPKLCNAFPPRLTLWTFSGICMAVPDKPQQQSGLTIRSLVVCLVALFVMGIWIEYEELYNTYGGPLAENSPANSAVGTICAVVIIGGVLHKLRKSLRLVTAELVVIYSALILAAPLMTQGLWHRFFGLVTGIPHCQDFKSYESLPPMLWPHGENLAANGRFEKGSDGFVHFGGGTLGWTQVEWKSKLWKSPVLSNGSNRDAQATLALTLNRRDKSGKEVLVPGENFLVSALVKADGFAGNSSYFIKMQADDGPIRPLLVNTEATKATFALPGGLRRIGVNPVIIPTDIKEKLTLYFGISGQGTLMLQDIQFFNVEAVEGLYTGRKFVREAHLSAFGPNELRLHICAAHEYAQLGGHEVSGQRLHPAAAMVLAGSLVDNIDRQSFHRIPRPECADAEAVGRK